MYDELKVKNDTLLADFIKQKDEENIKRHSLIAKMLQQPKLFLNIDISVAYDILYSLGYDKEQATEIYLKYTAVKGE